MSQAAPAAVRDFEGRVAVITGAGRGFGKAFAEAIAARGGHPVLLDIDLDAAQAAAAEIRAAGGQATAYGADVSDEDQVGAVFADVVAQLGGVDILINNAGLHGGQPGPLTDLAAVRRVIDVNVMGVVICTLAARPAMTGRPGACVFNVASCSSYSSTGSYGVSKLAVRGLTVAFAHELGKDNIRVNGVSPGLHLTGTLTTQLSPETLARVKAQQILPLDGNENDIVEAMLWLCSGRARFVTGETLRVSAGKDLYLT